jgi:DTW domain-containing protein YfiP
MCLPLYPSPPTKENHREGEECNDSPHSRSLLGSSWQATRQMHVINTNLDRVPTIVIQSYRKLLDSTQAQIAHTGTLK